MQLAQAEAQAQTGPKLTEIQVKADLQGRNQLRHTVAKAALTPPSPGGNGKPKK
jgi:hypothetical protein